MTMKDSTKENNFEKGKAMYFGQEDVTADMNTQILGNDLITQLSGNDLITHLSGNDLITQLSGNGHTTQISGNCHTTQISGNGRITQILGNDLVNWFWKIEKFEEEHKINKKTQLIRNLLRKHNEASSLRKEVGYLYDQELPF